MHCLPHTLELAAAGAWDTDAAYGFTHLMDFQTKMYYFFEKGQRSAVAKEIAEMYDTTLHPLTPLRGTRWVATDARSLERIQQAWQVLMTYFETETRKASADKAVYFYRFMKNRKCNLYMYAVLDLLQLLGVLSKELQKSQNIIMGKTETIRGFHARLLEYRNQGNAGPKLQAFLDSVKCAADDEDDPVACHTIDSYLSSSLVMRGDIFLEDNDAQAKCANFEDIREYLIDALIEKMQEYFPVLTRGEPRLHHQIKLDAFDFLMPSRLPDNVFVVDTYGKAEIEYICNKFDLDFSQIHPQWIDLLKKLISSNDSKSRKTSASMISFWGFFLRKTDYMGPGISGLIQTALIVPSSSAGVERTFSILKHIKYDRRSSLRGESLNAHLRIRVNGRDTKYFKAVKYAMYWVATGHMLSDSPTVLFNPQAGMTAKEKLMFETTHYNVEDEYIENELFSDLF